MNAVSGAGNDYLNMVQLATQRNTYTQVAEAKQSGKPVDVEQLQSSNQELRENARETGVALYTQSLQKQTFETYVNASERASDSYSSNSDNDNSSDVYTFDAARVNDALQTAQKRSFGVALYENLGSQQERPELSNPSTRPVNVYV